MNPRDSLPVEPQSPVAGEGEGCAGEGEGWAGDGDAIAGLSCAGEGEGPAVHAPFTQLCPLWQGWLQAPQLLLSVRVLVQVPQEVGFSAAMR